MTSMESRFQHLPVVALHARKSTPSQAKVAMVWQAVLWRRFHECETIGGPAFSIAIPCTGSGKPSSGGDPPRLNRTQMLQVVPWNTTKGYLTMLRTPKGKAKRALHIASLNHGEKGFHGQGMYVADAALWLAIWSPR